MVRQGRHQSQPEMAARRHLFSGKITGKPHPPPVRRRGPAADSGTDDLPAAAAVHGASACVAGQPAAGNSGLPAGKPPGGSRRPPELRNHAPRGGGGRTMKLKENFVLRQVAGSYAVLAVGPYKRARISISPLLAGPNSV